ncbi:hypothetical protein BKA15_005506 [Microlunatus parietis]|uniref:Uncharacterized protein n=1 Tax=Microlunatus parietis TaxID=682979 RepID=A0A7Y9LDR0_9ACTN|nr:polysaccharide lyase beta-sandwich domain-containing protein [Microlunatus parietis]NYE74177.1 hypothetical protein [Microlunatus parietis]
MIKHAGGRTTVRVDQRTNGAAWNELGVFDFEAGSYYVEVNNDNAVAEGYVIADAVKLSPAGAAPCSVIMQQRAGELKVAVADPTHESASVTVNLNQPGYRSYVADDTITVHQLQPKISFSVNTRGAAGVSRTVTFRRA